MLHRNMALSPRSFAFTLLIAALAAMPPLSIDMSLPAMNAIGAALDAPPSQTGLTLSLFLVGFALAQLGFGPLSDRFGRRAPLIAACTLFTASGLLCALADDVGALLAWRFVEGAGAGGATVLAFAIVRDRFEGVDARAKMGAISAVMSVAPMLAPSLGALVLRFGDWRLIFLFLAIAGLALTLVVGLAVDESIPSRDPLGLAPRRLLRSYARALAHRSAMGHTLIGAASFGCLFSFVSGSPFVFIGVLGLGTGWFALLFATCALGLTAGSLLCARLLRMGFDPHRLLAIGVLCQGAFSFALLALDGVGAFDVGYALPLVVLANVSMGVVAPLAVHGAMEPFRGYGGRRLGGARLRPDARRRRRQRSRRRSLHGNSDRPALVDDHFRAVLDRVLAHPRPPGPAIRLANSPTGALRRLSLLPMRVVFTGTGPAPSSRSEVPHICWNVILPSGPFFQTYQT